MQVMLVIWGDASVQRQLKGTVRNSHVFDNIVKELARKGYQHDEKQCEENSIRYRPEWLGRLISIDSLH